MEQRGEHHVELAGLAQHDARGAHRVAEEGRPVLPVETVHQTLSQLVGRAKACEVALGQPGGTRLIHELGIGQCMIPHGVTGPSEWRAARAAGRA